MQISKLINSERVNLAKQIRSNESVNKCEFLHENSAVEIDDELLFSTSAVERHLRSLNVKLKILTNVPVCACGDELKVVEYKGYYDSFMYLECQNEHCNYLDNADIDINVKGSYG